MTGSNQFHGNLFYNFNFEKLNANSFFNNSSGTPQRQVGCPPVRRPDRRTGLEEQDRSSSSTTKICATFFRRSGVVSLPSPQLQAYTLAHVGAAQLPLYQDYFNLVKGSPGINRASPGDQRHRPVAGWQRPPGMRHQQFQQDSHRNGRNIWRGHPLRGGLRHQQHRNQHRTVVLTSGVMSNISNSQKLSVRYFHDAGVQATGTSPINPLYNSVSNQPSYQVSLSRIPGYVSPTMVNTCQRLGPVVHRSVRPPGLLKGRCGHAGTDQHFATAAPTAAALPTWAAERIPMDSPSAETSAISSSTMTFPGARAGTHSKPA